MSEAKLVELEVSAPGKLILFGEHAVVYGKTALAASLGLRTRLNLKELSDREHCEMEMPGVGLSSLRLSLEELLSTGDDDEDEDRMHSRVLERARHHVGKHVNTELDQRQRCSLECVLYALSRVARAEGLSQLDKGFRLKLTSDLPLGAGLGSSASFSVCLVTGFLSFMRLRRHGVAPTLDHEILRQISRHAFGCEKIMHGAPSGVDNEMCTFGSVIEFRRGEEPKLISLDGSPLAGLRVLLVNTQVARSTKALVGKLAKLRERYPEVFQSVFEAIDQVSRRVVEVVKPNGSCSEEKACRQLSELIDINQGLLTTCQVSHPSIGAICATAKRHGLSAKLTGAGGGGFVYVLVPPDVSAVKLQEVTAELTAAEFLVTETSLGGSGVLVHDAAVLYSAREALEE